METQQKLCNECKGPLLENNIPDTRKAEHFQGPCVTTDAVVLRKNEKTNSHEILLITRKFDPYKDCFAFPGGFVDYNEDPIQGCLRELEEECGLKGNSIELLTVKSDPKRDPRKHIVSIFYVVEVDADAKENAGDDAATCKFYDVNELRNQKEKFAFDHYEVFEELIKKKNI